MNSTTNQVSYAETFVSIIFVLLTVYVSVTLIGCEYLPEVNKDVDKSEPVVNESVDTTPEHLKNQPGADYIPNSTSDMFYLKYVANDGKGCLLMPLRVKGTDVERATIAGNKTRQPYYPVLDDQGKIRNGGRLHIRLHEVGSIYQNCDVIIYYHDGSSEVFPVGVSNHPDGYKKRYN